MKHLTLQKFVPLVLLFLFALELCSQGLLKVESPRQRWRSGQVTIDELTIVVKPGTHFSTIDYYIEYQGKPEAFVFQNDTMEIQHFFSMPANYSFIDSWLWVGDVIMKADIYKRNKATEIYEGIVRRNQDPSILYKNSAFNYEFRIFPVLKNQSRKVKLSVLAPIHYTQQGGEIFIPTKLFKYAAELPNTINLKIISNDKNELFTNNTPKNIVTAEENGVPVHYCILSKSDINNDLLITSSLKADDKADLQIHEDTLSGTKYFQYIFNSDALIDQIPTEISKHIIAINHETNSCSISKAEIINSVNYFIKSLNPHDSIYIIHNRLLHVNELFKNWVAVKDYNPFLGEFKDHMISDIGQLDQVLFKAYSKAKGNSAIQVTLFNSGIRYFNNNNALVFLEQLRKEFGTLPRTNIFDYSDARIHKVIFNSGNNNTIFGDANLFTKLASETSGDYQTINYIDNWGLKNHPLNNLIEQYSKTLSSKSIKSFDFNIEPADGISYQKYSIKNGNQYILTGKYIGEDDFDAKFIMIHKDKPYVLRKKLPINTAIKTTTDQLIFEYNNLKILNIESNSNLYNEVTQASLKHRILCLHTAFLALEPGLQLPCGGCVPDDNILVTTDDKSKDKEIKIKASPNPFNAKVDIIVEGVKISQIKSLGLFDLKGVKVEVDYDISENSEETTISIDGSNLESGIYIFRIVCGNKVLNYKLVKV